MDSVKKEGEDDSKEKEVEDLAKKFEKKVGAFGIPRSLAIRDANDDLGQLEDDDSELLEEEEEKTD